MNKIQEFLIKYLSHDKLLHFFLGFFIYAIASLFLSDLLTFILVFAIAVAKEIRDEIAYKGADIEDVIYTVIPAFTMLIINNLDK